MSLLISIVLAIAFMVFFPSTAGAHLVTTGLGPFYDGAMHLLLSPGDLLGLVAAVLLAGLNGARASRLTVMVLPTAWLISSLVGLNMQTGIDLPWLSVLSFLILGILVAVNPKLPTIVVVSIAMFYGVLHGLLNGSALGSIGAGLLTLIGIAVTVLIIGLLCSALIVSLRAAWTRIAVRVVGSWLAAVGMLMLGWLVRGSG